MKYVDLNGVEWERVGVNAQYVLHSEICGDIWCAEFRKVGAEGSLSTTEWMYFNSAGECWE